MIEKGFLGIKPIKFNEIEFIGDFYQTRMSSAYYLSKQFIQNILYAAYHKAITIKDIANLLAVDTNLVKDEVYHLEDNGFMDKVSEDKYITNILIHDLPIDICEKRNKLFSEYANIVCKKYMPTLFNEFVGNAFIRSELDIEHLSKQGIYVPENDINFLMYSIVTLACCKNNVSHDILKHYIKRNDGSEYIAVASLHKSFLHDNSIDKYNTSGEIIITHHLQEVYPFVTWHYNTFYDSRRIDLRYISNHLFECLYDFIIGRLKCNSDLLNQSSLHKTTSIDIFNNLLKHGFITESFNKNTNYNVNMITSKMSMIDLLSMIPEPPDDFKEINYNLYENIFNLCKDFYPEHRLDLFNDFCKNIHISGEVVSRVLEILLEKNMLKQLTDSQKKTVNMILFLNSK